MKRSYLFGLAAAALLGGIYIQGCGGGTGSADGGGCADDSECPTGNICDTQTGTCLVKCTADGGSAAACTGNETACQAFHNLSSNVCVCTSNSDCSNGGTCDTAKGTCTLSNTGADGGTSGTTGACDASNLCPNGQFCSNGTCTAGTACTTPNAQSDCEAGQACFSGSDPSALSQGNICETIGNPDGTCSISSPPSTDPASDPVIWGVTKTSTRTDSSGACSTGTVDEFTGYWYDGSGSLSSGTSAYSHLVVIHSDGSTETSGGTVYRTFENGTFGADGTFTFELCTDNNEATAVAATAASDNTGLSNAACVPMPL